MPDNDAEREPTLEDLAVEAAMLLETLPNYVSDNTLRQAEQIAFALRARLGGHRATAPVVATDDVEGEK